jgi:modification methylase
MWSGSKPTPCPIFRGCASPTPTRRCCGHKRKRDKKYTFNYHAMKGLNEDLQMRSDWHIPICTGAERSKDPDGSKAHPTQKPEALLYRVILASSNPGDVVLDPFFGTGTTGAVARRLHRHYMGIEIDPAYAGWPAQRIGKSPVSLRPADLSTPNPRRERRIPFGTWLKTACSSPGKPSITAQRRDHRKISWRMVNLATWPARVDSPNRQA